MKIFQLLFVVLLGLTSVISQDNPLYTKLLQVVKPDCGRSRWEIKNDVDDFNTCIENQFKQIGMSMVAGEDAAIKGICNLDLATCVNNLGSRIKSCMTDEQYKQILEDPKKALVSAQSYSCQNGGQPLKDFMTKGKECFGDANVNAKFQQCTKADPEFTKNMFSDAFQSDAACRKQGDMARCFVKALDSCEDKTARSFMGGLLYNMLKETDCKTIMEKEYSDVNAASILSTNFLTLIAIFIGYIYSL